MAQRLKRAYSAIKAKSQEAIEELEEGIEKTREVLRSVKEYHLFAKAKEAKDLALKKILLLSQELISKSQGVMEKLSQPSKRGIKSAVEKINTVIEVTQILIPQVWHWINTAEVAKAKILHVGISTARAIVKNKAGKRVEFGLKWLINRLEGGYLFGKVVEAHSDERKMPLLALEEYRKVFGEGATPEMEV